MSFPHPTNPPADGPVDPQSQLVLVKNLDKNGKWDGTVQLIYHDPLGSICGVVAPKVELFKATLAQFIHGVQVVPSPVPPPKTIVEPPPGEPGSQGSN